MAKKQSKNKLGLGPEKLKMVIIAVFAVAVGAIGTYMITKSSAAVIYGSGTSCGYSYGDNALSFPRVQNITYKIGLKDSDSVRNLAKYTCEKGFLRASRALLIGKTGAWDYTLSLAIRAFELSDPRLAEAADGIPDAKMVCVLAERKITSSEGTYYYYGAPLPSGFPNDNCFSLLGTYPDPLSK